MARSTCRFFWISPPIDGSKSTHQTLLRFIGDIPGCGFSPLMSLRLASFIRRHVSVGGLSDPVEFEGGQE